MGLTHMAFDAIQQGTVLAALPTSQDGAVDSFGDDIPPERAMPVNPVAARQTGLP